MKHGISPTTNRNRRWERDTIVHLSKALVQRVIDPNKKGEIDGRVEVQLLPLHLQAPEGCMVSIVVAPDKGVTYKRAEAKPERPGLTRRYWLTDRLLTEKRLRERQNDFVDFSGLL